MEEKTEGRFTQTFLSRFRRFLPLTTTPKLNPTVYGPWCASTAPTSIYIYIYTILSLPSPIPRVETLHPIGVRQKVSRFSFSFVTNEDAFKLKLVCKLVYPLRGIKPGPVFD